MRLVFEDPHLLDVVDEVRVVMGLLLLAAIPVSLGEDKGLRIRRTSREEPNVLFREVGQGLLLCISSILVGRLMPIRERQPLVHHKVALIYRFKLLVQKLLLVVFRGVFLQKALSDVPAEVEVTLSPSDQL